MSPLSQFLGQSGRLIHQIKGDGNCLFRALAFHLLGDEDEHFCVCSYLVRLENFNCSLFEARLIPGPDGVTKATIEDHTKLIMRPWVWSTHVEMVAAATLFRAPIYYVRKRNRGEGYHWEVCHPMTLPAHTYLRLPELSEEDPLYSASPPTHFELSYTDDLHYDCVVSAETRKPCQSPPKLLSTHYIIDMISP